MKEYMKSARHLTSRFLIRLLFIVFLLLFVYTFIWLFITRNQLIITSTDKVKLVTQQVDMLVQNYFTVKFASLSTNPQTVEDLEAILRKDPDIQELSLVGGDGVEMIKMDRTKVYAEDELTNVSDTSEFKIATFLEGKPYVSLVQDNSVKLSVPVRAKTGSGSGALIARVEVYSLLDKVEDKQRETKEFISVFDEKGNILRGSEKIPSQDQSVSYSTQNEITKWNIVAHFPLAVILQPMKQIEFFAGILFVASLIFAGLLSLTLQNSFIVSLRKVQDGVLQFRKGNLHHIITVHTGDEVEDISQGINAMSLSVREAQETVEQDKRAMAAEREQLAHTLAMEKQQLTNTLATEREKMNNTLRDETGKMSYVSFAEKEKLQFILGHLKDAVVILSKTRTVVYVNKAAEELLGYKANELNGKPINAVVKFFEKDREMFWDEYASLTPNNDTKDGIFTKENVRMQNDHISPCVIRLVSAFAGFSHSDDLGFMLIIHELKEESAISKSQANLIETMSQQLQSPFTFMNEGLSFFLQKDPTTRSQEDTTYLAEMKMGVDELSYLINNFLTVASIDSNSVSLHTDSVDMVALIDEAVQDAAPLAALRLSTIKFDHPQEQMGTITCDKAAVRTVLGNLLRNAAIAMQTAGEILVSLKKTESEVIVQVQDTGRGIPTDAMPQLFTKFYQVPNVSVTGLGLGLYISKVLVEMHKGKIWCDSIEGRGSVFSFSLPTSTTTTTESPTG